MRYPFDVGDEPINGSFAKRLISDSDGPFRMGPHHRAFVRCRRETERFGLAVILSAPERVPKSNFVSGFSPSATVNLAKKTFEADRL